MTTAANKISLNKSIPYSQVIQWFDQIYNRDIALSQQESGLDSDTKISENC